MPDSVMRPSEMEMMRLARADGAQTVGNDQRWCGPAQVVEGTLDFGFRHGIQGGGGLVQKSEWGDSSGKSGQWPPAASGAGEQGAPLAYIGLEALGMAWISA